MATPNRAYTEFPSSVAPDVPYWGNAGFRDIDLDVQAVWDRLNKPKTVPNGTDWNTVLTPGLYSLDSFANSATMTNLPPMPGTGNSFAGSILVFPVTTTKVAQLAIEYATSNPGKIWTRSAKVAAGFEAWETPSARTTAIVTGQDLNTLPFGRHKAETSAIAISTLNNPGVVNPFSIDVFPMSIGSGANIQVLTEYGDTGPIVSTRQSLAGTYQGWNTAAVPPSRVKLDDWGTSLTAGSGVGETWTAAETWPARAGTVMPGTTVTNKGRSGDTTDEILIRMGVHSIYFAVTGGSIPTAGAVAVTTKFKSYIPRDRSFPGSLAGVAGTLAFTFATNTWTFTRTTGGSAVAVAGSVLFVTDQLSTKKNAFTFEAYRNDADFNVTGLEGSIEDHVIANHRKVLDFLPGGDKRVIFLGPTLNVNEKVGTAGYTRVWSTVNRMKYLFPGTFFSLLDYLIDHALDDAGITKTAADITAIANREAPPSIFITGDTTHFRKEIADVVGRLFVAPIILAKGYVN